MTFEATSTTYPDGVASKFVFTGTEVARPIWRYPDLGPQVVYLSDIIGRTLTK